MNVTKISAINFTGKIIDSHAHIGRHDGDVYTKEQLDVFVKNELPNKDVVEKIFVSNLDVLHSIKGEYEGNIEALNLFKDSSEYEVLASKWH